MQWVHVDLHRWIARQYLNGSRTEIAVGREVRDMMVKMLKSLKVRAVTANSAIVTTQDNPRSENQRSFKLDVPRRTMT